MYQITNINSVWRVELIRGSAEIGEWMDSYATLHRALVHVCYRAPANLACNGRWVGERFVPARIVSLAAYAEAA